MHGQICWIQTRRERCHTLIDRRRRITMTIHRQGGFLLGKMNTLTLILTTLSLFGGVGAQVDLCSCAPAEYSFTFDFGLTCPPVNITRDGGVATTVCQISPFGDPGEEIEDLVPVRRHFGCNSRRLAIHVNTHSDGLGFH